MDESKPDFLLLQWHITERCDHRCRHCYREENGGAEPGRAEMREVISQYETLVATIGRRGHIHVAGGEPLLHGDLWFLLEELARRRERFSFALLTSGSGIDRQVAGQLARLQPRFVQVSLDGEETTHDRWRGEGDHRRVVQAVRHLVGEGVPTVVSFTAHRENWQDFPAVARLGARLGVEQVWGDRLIPIGAGEQVQNQVLSPQETARWLTSMAGQRRGWWPFGGTRSRVTMRRALQFLKGGGRPYRCVAGERLLALTPGGEVLPCRRLPLPVGRIQDQGLGEIWRGSALLRRLRDPNQRCDGCEGCFYEPMCRGGLRCLAHALTGNPWSKDPGCWRGRNLGEQPP